MHSPSPYRIVPPQAPDFLTLFALEPGFVASALRFATSVREISLDFKHSNGLGETECNKIILDNFLQWLALFKNLTKFCIRVPFFVLFPDEYRLEEIFRIVRRFVHGKGKLRVLWNEGIPIQWSEDDPVIPWYRHLKWEAYNGQGVDFTPLANMQRGRGGIRGLVRRLRRT